MAEASPVVLPSLLQAWLSSGTFRRLGSTALDLFDGLCFSAQERSVLGTIARLDTDTLGAEAAERRVCILCSDRMWGGCV